MLCVCSSGEEILCSLISPRAAIICPLQSSCSLRSVFPPPPVPGRQSTADVFMVPAAALLPELLCIHTTAVIVGAFGGSVVQRRDLWIDHTLAPSSIVIVASLPHVWSDYPMALMIERQDWGLRVINDFESCHHLPNLCRVTWPRSTSTASTVTRRMSCIVPTATDLSKIFLRWELGIPSLSKQCFSTLGSFQTRSKSNQSQASIQSNIKYETWTCLHSNLHRGPLF